MRPWCAHLGRKYWCFGPGGDCSREGGSGCVEAEPTGHYALKAESNFMAQQESGGASKESCSVYKYL